VKSIFYILAFSSILQISSCQRIQSNSHNYIDTRIPAIQPLVFAKDFISHDSISEFGSVFNKELTEFYYAIDTDGKAEIKQSNLKDGKWSAPETIISDTTFGFNDPFLSPDESKLYYISNYPRNDQDTIKDYDIWYSERKDGKWSNPINAGLQINTDADEYYMSFTNEGTMYYASNRDNLQGRKRDFDIFKSPIVNGKFGKGEKLGPSINTKYYEADVFVAPDESYLIFCSIRKSGLGNGDMYISFMQDNKQWSPAISMGSPINTPGHELCPFVSSDGKYFFYTSSKDIYWVSTEVIEQLKGN